VFEIFGHPARGKKCEAIEGIIAEGDTIMREYKGTAALDAWLISSAQAVEHDEITRYGTLRRWAEMLGQRNAASRPDRSLKEEAQTDAQLNMIAEQANQTDKKPASKATSPRSSKKAAAPGGQQARVSGEEAREDRLQGEDDVLQDGENASS